MVLVLACILIQANASKLQSNRQRREAIFGNSDFDESRIPLNGIKDIVYDYDYDSYDSYEEDLYSEDFYGDYDQTFTPPPKSKLPVVASSNPFGVPDLNFDEYALSDIRNIEYDYDYDDEYNEVDVVTVTPTDPDTKTKLEEMNPPVI